MQQRNYKDIAYGIGLVAFGLWIFVYAATNYHLGTPAQMGPGLFPAGVGTLIGVLGAVIALTGALRNIPADDGPRLDLRATISVLSAIGVFALSVTTLGLFPAIILMVGIASLADDKLKPHKAALLALALCTFAYLVFNLGLGMPWPLWRSPF